MKLLFDENLAGRLGRDLSDLYPGSADVLTLGMGGAADRDVWSRAARDGFILVTKDEDFHRLSVLLGPPPKVIWIRLGNASTAAVEQLLRSKVDDVRAFVEAEEASFLVLG